jgi:hypothetical protein
LNEVKSGSGLEIRNVVPGFRAAQSGLLKARSGITQNSGAKRVARAIAFILSQFGGGDEGEEPARRLGRQLDLGSPRGFNPAN